MTIILDPTASLVHDIADPGPPAGDLQGRTIAIRIATSLGNGRGGADTKSGGSAGSSRLAARPRACGGSSHLIKRTA